MNPHMEVDEVLEAAVAHADEEREREWERQRLEDMERREMEWMRERESSGLDGLEKALANMAFSEARLAEGLPVALQCEGEPNRSGGEMQAPRT